MHARGDDGDEPATDGRATGGNTGDEPATDGVTAWLRRSAVPLDSVDPGAVTGDLAALTAILSGTSIVGFADITHGTREFYRLRHRLLRHLVTEMGFNALAIEASHSATQLINEYVLTGNGDRAAVVTGLGSVMWDVQEFAEVVDWLRAHNRSVSPADRVRVHGLGMWGTRVGREKVLSYLRSTAPGELETASELFHRIATGEAAGMLLAHRHMDAALLQGVRDLADFLTAHRQALVDASSPEAYDDVAAHVEAIRQWVAVNLSDEIPDESLPGTPGAAGFNNLARTIYMARNLVRLTEHAGPPARIVVWAHTFHLGVDFTDRRHGTVPNMGRYLRNRFGEQYYAFAMETDRGEYLAREMLPDGSLGDFTTGSVPPAPDGSLAWHLARTGEPSFLIDLRSPVRDRRVREWLAARRTMHCAGWGRPARPERYTTVSIEDGYDGLIFIADTSPTTPTPNARNSVSRRTAH